MVNGPFERQQATGLSMNASVLAALYGKDEALALDVALQGGVTLNDAARWPHSGFKGRRL